MTIFNAPVINNIGEKAEIDKCEEEIRKRAAARLLSYLKWTKEELSWRMDDYTCKQFRKAMTIRIKCATTGCFIKNWNFGEVRDECQGLFSMLDLEFLEGRLNGWCEDERSLLKTLLHKLPDGFSWHQLVHYINVLRLTRLQICNMDETLSRLLQLKALILLSNLMTDCDGSILPKDLRFLELYNNSMTDINKLAFDPPTKLLYLGVGRNQLSTSQSLQALVNFNNLFYLDISDNDFLELPECLNLIKVLPALNSLSLYGTPCSVTVSYRRMVQTEIPQLLLFDGVDLKKCPIDIVEQNIATKAPKGKKKGPKGKDDSANDSEKRSEKSDKRKGDKKKKGAQIKEEEFDLTGELQVYCFRVFGVKEPKKEKNLKHLYFFELECPLLDDGLKEYELQRMKSALDGTGELDEELMAICGMDSNDRTVAAGFKNDRVEEDKTKGDKSKDDKAKGDKAKGNKVSGDESKGKKLKSRVTGDKRSQSGGGKKKSTDNHEGSQKRGGRRTSRGDSTTTGYNKDNQRNKTDDGRETKKYLIPLNKTCQDRHKFSNVGVRWTRLGRKCFLFKHQNMGWVSSENLQPKITTRENTRGLETEVKSSMRDGDKDDFDSKQTYSASKKENTLDTRRGKSKEKTGTEFRSASDRKKKLKGEPKESDKTKNKKVSSKDEALDAKGKHKPGSSIEGSNKDESSKKMLSPKSQKMTAKLELENMKNNLKSLIDKDEEIEGSTKFKTKEIEWARILEFKQPIVIKTTDLLALRDIFRTVLTLRFIHTKVKISKADANKKATKKGQESQNKEIESQNLISHTRNTSSFDWGMKSVLNCCKEIWPVKMISDDNVLLREKLAVVQVPLEAIKWNEKYLGYKWDISKPCLAEKCPNIKDMKFGKKGNNNNFLAIISSRITICPGKKVESTSKTKTSAKVQLPTEPEMLTVHLGIGVKRDTFF